MAGQSTDQLYALVDMGSNGIRFSISSLAPPTTRSLPTIYQSRLGISLYDAQYSDGQKVPIPQDVIHTILAELKRFKQTSLDFDVPQTKDNVRILATEATRNAINSAEFINAIHSALGEPWQVDLLKKDDEGRIGALGVVSSVGGITGLEGMMMDLGGGSTQLTWLIAHPGEEMQTSPLGSISFPYGAAAMTRMLSETDDAKHSKSARDDLRKKMISQFEDAFKQLALPETLLARAKSHGLRLYLSGGGFRGWGYLLMSSHRIKPHPIPIINGFSVPIKDFKNTLHVTSLAKDSLLQQVLDGTGVFRVSKRRAAQVPAVSFLVSALVEAIPVISEVRFCQGGVREGWLFDKLPAEIRAHDPLVAASGKFARDEKSAIQFADLLGAALPADCPVLDRHIPSSIRDTSLLIAFANAMFLQQGHSKESAAVNALHVPITGVLASAHGVGHSERALLSLMLCQRWGGGDDLPPPHGETRERLQMLLKPQEIWWGRYLGTLGACIAEIYPAARTRGEKRVALRSKWADGLGKKGNMQGVIVTMSADRETVGQDVINGIVEDIENVGKKKNRVGGKEYGFGVTLRVDVEQL